MKARIDAFLYDRFGGVGGDFVALGTAIAAILLFVGTGSRVLPQAMQAWLGDGNGPDRTLVSVLLLNIALVIFGWRRYAGLHSELGKRREAEEQARQLAETDPLTGCLNRRGISSAIERLHADAALRGEVVACLMIDLDNFKRINDYNGHGAGDEVLRECARRIGQVLPKRSVLARLGGDEFLCAAPLDPAHAENADRLGAALVETIAAPAEAGGTVIEARVSVGIARSDQLEDGFAADALMHMADIAMYHAKKQGKNRYCWFEAQMESELRFRAELEAGVRRGIEAGEFVPYYEQQMNLVTGELTGFEMLARWKSPQLGTVGPDVFIPIAEEAGLIARLSESLIAQALEDAKGWDARLTLAVNVSPVQLRDPWFAQKLLKLLVEANFPAHRLEIEITESCIHENASAVRTLVASLKNQGIRISLDDFGTGYSSLAQLRSLPFDRIKIDRSFVRDFGEDKDSEAIVKAIASLGEGLGLPVTVEGIESAEVLEQLRDVGEFKGQGYLYGRPESAETTRVKLAKLGLLAKAEPAPAEPAPEKADEPTELPRAANA